MLVLKWKIFKISTKNIKIFLYLHEWNNEVLAKNWYRLKKTDIHGTII